MTDLILYTTEDAQGQIKLRADQQTVRLTQLEMAEPFDATKQNISMHIKNIVEDAELDENSVFKDSLTTESRMDQAAVVKVLFTTQFATSCVANSLFAAHAATCRKLRLDRAQGAYRAIL